MQILKDWMIVIVAVLALSIMPSVVEWLVNQF